MHDQVRVRKARVDLLDPVDGENVTRRFAGEFVGAVRGAYCNRERIDSRCLHEVRRLRRVRQQLLVTKPAVRARAIFLAGHTGFERTQAPQFALD